MLILCEPLIVSRFNILSTCSKDGRVLIKNLLILQFPGSSQLPYQRRKYKKTKFAAVSFPDFNVRKDTIPTETKKNENHL